MVIKLNGQDKNNIELEIKFLISPDKVSRIRENILSIPKISFRGKFYEKVIMYDNTDKLMDKEDARLRVKQISVEKDNPESKKAMKIVSRIYVIYLI